MLKLLRHHLYAAALAVLCTLTALSQNKPAAYVNPFIGTGGHGHTFPGAVLPFGMVQLSPDTRVDGSWDGCSGYHHSDSVIYGFSHTHLSGTGCSDWGDVLLMPALNQASDKKVYLSRFSHKDERASAGYYAVILKPSNIKVELTVTPRVGIHRYTFPKGSPGDVLLDLLHRDKTLASTINIKDSVTLVGSRVSEAWAKEQHIYFAIKFSKPFKKSALYADGRQFSKDNVFKGKMEKCLFSFNTADGEPLLIKVAISPVSEEGAMRNLNAEATHWDFERYKQGAEDAWNAQLGKMDVQDPDKNKLSVFYTALYHASIHPSLNMDVDNQYRGRDNKIHYADGFTNYSVFSLWDTYRALHPLFTIIERKRTTDFINSFLNQYRQSGRLPVWELSSNETDCMIGFHSVSVIADAMIKGIRGFDTLAVYDAMKAASNYTGFGIPVFNQKGYLSVEDQSESVSRSLEYAYDNWCIAQTARLLKKPEEEKLFLKRSLSYLNLFDASTGNMRPRRNGGWLSPFYANDINNHFTEGNSWHYSFSVPQDLEGLIRLHGGEAKFEAKLDEMFAADPKTRGRDQADVTGLIGQYAQGNEPSHHMAYLYNYVGKPQKTIDLVHRICRDFYLNTTDGLIGNEDCGQMSAWYLLSAMGLYPVCPGSDQYVLGEPAFSTIRLHLENGRTFTISANPLPGRPVTGIALNGQKRTTSFITHSDIMNGNSLSFLNEELDGKANGYGTAKSDKPFSSVQGVNVIAAPVIRASKQVFRDTVAIRIEQINTPVQFLGLYTVDGSMPRVGAPIYVKPVLLDSSCTVKAQLFAAGLNSPVTEARFTRLRNDYALTISSRLHEQYSADGAQTLIDGIKGDSDWRKGNWLGVWGQDFVCTADLKKVTDIHFLNLECLQDTRAWVLFPSKVEFYGSNDNKKFTLIGSALNTRPANDYTEQLAAFSTEPKVKIAYRYIKVVAKNFGKLPAWHMGAGGDAYIFTDELEIK